MKTIAADFRNISSVEETPPTHMLVCECVCMQVTRVSATSTRDSVVQVANDDADETAMVSAHVWE